MKQPMILLNLTIVIYLAAGWGCSTEQKSAPSSAQTKQASEHPAHAPQNKPDKELLQGTWKGQELTGEAAGPCYLIVSGEHFEFHGADTNEWYKGTFTLREDSNPRQLLGSVTECPAPQYVGKTSYAIYRLESRTLTLTAKEPGNPDLPSGFDASDARRFVFKEKQ